MLKTNFERFGLCLIFNLHGLKSPLKTQFEQMIKQLIVFVPGTLLKFFLFFSLNERAHWNTGFNPSVPLEVERALVEHWFFPFLSSGRLNEPAVTLVLTLLFLR